MLIAIDGPAGGNIHQDESVDGVRRNDSALVALNADSTVTPRDPQYETYQFYTTKTGGSQRC